MTGSAPSVGRFRGRPEALVRGGSLMAGSGYGVDGKRFDAVDVPRPEASLLLEGMESEGGEG